MKPLPFGHGTESGCRGHFNTRTKAERYDKEHPEVSPTTPSGMIPVYLKPARGKRRKPPGRKEGHPGVSRKIPQRIDHYEEHTLLSCPECQTSVNEPINTYCRIIEDIPEVKPQVTAHTVHGYWCRTCKKIVYPTVAGCLAQRHDWVKADRLYRLASLPGRRECEQSGQNGFGLLLF